MQDGSRFCHFHHEGGLSACQIVRRANPAEQPVDRTQTGGLGGHRQPGLRQHGDQGVLAQEGRLTRHVRAGQQQHPPVRRKVAPVRDEGGFPGQGGLNHRMAAVLHHEFVAIRDDRAAPVARFRKPRRRLGGVEKRERIRTGRQSVGVVERGAHQMTEYQAFPSRRAFPGFRYATIQVRQRRFGEPRAIGHTLTQGQLGELPQLFDRYCRHLDNVAELGMVFDLEARDAKALRVVQLHRRQHPARVVAQRPVRVEFAVVA